MYLVAIPRHCRGNRDVSRSKRPQGGANAALHSWGHLIGGYSPPQTEMVHFVVFLLLVTGVPPNHSFQGSHCCDEVPRTQKCSSTGLRFRSPSAHFVRTALMANKFLIISSSDIGQVQP